jgi:hypothetical protein
VWDDGPVPTASAIVDGGTRPGRRELVAVGALYLAVLAATFVTYARVPAADLYNVGAGGLAGGLSRALIELNFPDALIAVPLALIAVDVLRERWAAVVAACAIPACLVTAVPGVVDQGDLDAKPVNAVPAAGVALTLVLLAAAFPRLAATAPRLAGDAARLVLAGALAVATVPYVFAELGFYAPDPILADEPTPGDDIAAVHLGSHEGMDGALLAFAALALSRLTPWFTGKRLAVATSALLALLLAYGFALLVQDDWLEQVVKRGWTDHRIPSLVRPQLSVGWALIVTAAAAVELLWFRRERAAAGPAGAFAAPTAPS